MQGESPRLLTFSQPKGGVSEPGRVVDLGFVENDGDFDLGGGYHLDVHAAIAEAFEKGCGDAGVGAHADSDHAELGDAALFEDFASGDFRADPLDDRADFFQFFTGDRDLKPASSECKWVLVANSAAAAVSTVSFRSFSYECNLRDKCLGFRLARSSGN